MSLNIFLLWLANIALDSGGQLAFKAAARQEHPDSGLSYWLFILKHPFIQTGILCYIAEFLLWLAFLSVVPLSQGVILGSINIVTLMLGGHFLFQERLTAWRLTGMSLVAMGVTLVGII